MVSYVAYDRRQQTTDASDHHYSGSLTLCVGGPVNNLSRFSGDELLVVVTRQRRCGPRWPRVNDDNDQLCSQVRIQIQENALGDGRLRPQGHTWRFRPSYVIWRHLTGVATWRSRRNTRVVFDSDLFDPLHERMTSSTKPEVHNVSHCRQRKNWAIVTCNMYRKFREL